MLIQVRYFAVLRERLGRDEETLALPEGATVAAAMAALGERHPALRAVATRVRPAVNQEMTDGSRVLSAGDELALIPPVAGGGEEAARVARIVGDRPPALERVVDAVRSPRMGGVVTFVGYVRAENQGHAVERLEYEAYAAMADKVLAGLCEAIEAEIPGCRVAVEHRTGALAVGDVAVAIAAAAPHRAEAFAACREMIERLKRAVPIWKKEIGPDGAEWIGIGP